MLTAAADVFGEALAKATRYVDILGARGVEWGLIGPRETDRLWERHVLNSVAVSDAIPSGARVIDVGSGAGLPGIPLALARPDLSITLLEPLLRRANFLDLAVEELDLGGRVTVVRGRAEEHGTHYDVVTCRAVAKLSKLLGWTLPLFHPGGRLVALKGDSAADELGAASAQLARLHLTGRVDIVSVHPDVDSTRLIIVE